MPPRTDGVVDFSGWMFCFRRCSGFHFNLEFTPFHICKSRKLIPNSIHRPVSKCKTRQNHLSNPQKPKHSSTHTIFKRKYLSTFAILKSIMRCFC